METAVSTELWLQKVLEAAGEVASTTFDSVANDVQPLEGIPSGREGSLLSVTRGSEAVQLGVMADSAGCIALTRALLQMEEDEEVGEEDVSDAVGEIINILAGVVQRSLEGNGPDVTLGYPMYIKGHVYPPSNAEARYASINLGPARADLMVVRGQLNGHHEND